VVDLATQAAASPGDSGMEPEHASLSQGRLALRRFLRHRLAIGSLILLLLLFGAALAGGVIAPYGFDEITDSSSSPPSLDHPMGTDAIGHDLLSQVLRGSQKSVQVAIIVTVVSTIIGVVVGALAGYYRGIIDAILSRFTDFTLTIPLLAVLLVVANRVSSRQGNFVLIGLLIAAFIWPQVAVVVRATFLSLREKEFVEAARAIGASDARIIFRHMLPNALGPIIVSATLVVATAILIEATLAFLGFGVSPPDTSLGKLVSEGQQASNTRPWLFYFPGAVLLLICLCVNFVGDGLRDAFDPRQDKG